MDGGASPGTEQLVFWGGWEPPSWVKRSSSSLAEGPRFLHDPFMSNDVVGGWKQNTDPFVFGEQFHYTGCLQHTKSGPTQLRFLAQGSVILFGSCLARRKFVLDTVFVVAKYVDHHRADFTGLAPRNRVSATYFDATIIPWYSGEVPESQSHRLYFGATFDQPFEGMFSFFPGAAVNDRSTGFVRPTIDIREVVTPTQVQGKRLNLQPESIRCVDSRNRSSTGSRPGAKHRRLRGAAAGRRSPGLGNSWSTGEIAGPAVLGGGAQSSHDSFLMRVDDGDRLGFSPSDLNGVSSPART